MARAAVDFDAFYEARQAAEGGPVADDSIVVLTYDSKGVVPAGGPQAGGTCAGYLRKYAQYLQYDRYLAADYPIATGVVEGACRYLVRDRMELTGARWRLAGAEAVLKLRALRASGDFDAYWDFHEAREYERNHARQYADGTPPSFSEPPNPRPRDASGRSSSSSCHALSSDSDPWRPATEKSHTRKENPRASLSQCRSSRGTNQENAPYVLTLQQMCC